MAKKYVPEGAFLACDKGTSPSTLRVSNNKNTTIYSVPMASELDFLPFFNIKPMGLCTNPLKWATGASCLPTILTGWQAPKDGVKINGSRMLLEDSFCNCIFGGKINIFFDRAAAVSYGVGEGKMPSDYIKEGFDWIAEQNKKGREMRDQMLPDWMKPVTGVGDWFSDLGTGLVEGAVNGVVGLGETLYQVGQDPVGTAEALGGMVSDGWNAATEGVGNAWNWASKGDNWSNAAEGAWNWASDGQNWADAGSAAWEGTKDAAGWVAENPRKIGTTVGEFIPDVAAAAFSGGSSLALTGAKVAGKEALEEAGERIVREGVEEAGERAAKEGGEAVAARTGKELIESLGDDASDIAKVTDGTITDPPGTYRDTKGRLRDSKTNKFVEDPNKPPKNEPENNPNNPNDSNRPSWRKSEIDAEGMYPGYDTQKSFIDKKEVPYGTEGSTRPDLYTEGHSVEVKNYDVTSNNGRSNLTNELKRQYNDRLKNLPNGTRQTAVIDVRGQNVSPETLIELQESINRSCPDLEVIFMQ
ncbi:DUF4280 domain-containing protein [Chryseobacterium lathyri]|uniref:Uncharacterized protein n=1 Tax=Chryseobacterium lathyri TaxID=395933 RepID=A0A511Y6U5_9FLAO|nr:DUF4280 domain-containing protein [Chryseobacterium lathyri]GEN70911.1 hypothetical protein CLA01_09830 [Chryseobacterium lathyri]